MNAVDFKAVTYEGVVLCINCLPEGIGDDSEGVEPIFAASEWDHYPTCDDCGEEHTYVGLTTYGRKHHTLRETELHTWFERDRRHVELRSKKTEETLIEWWDEAVAEAVEDGFLKPRNYHQSAFDYAVEHGFITTD